MYFKRNKKNIGPINGKEPMKLTAQFGPYILQFGLPGAQETISSFSSRLRLSLGATSSSSSSLNPFSRFDYFSSLRYDFRSLIEL